MKNVLRLPVLLAGAVLLSLALGGCSLIGDAGQVWGIVQSDAAQKRALTAAVSAVKGIDGVESASSYFVADGPTGAEAELHIIASSSIAEEQLREIASTVKESFSSAELANTVQTLTLRFGDDDGGGVLTQRYLELSDHQFVTEIFHWRAIEAAIEAELSMVLTPGFRSGTYDRTFSAPDGVDAVSTAGHVIENFEALAAVPDATQNPTTWQFAGMLWSTQLPPATLVALLDSIRESTPLVDYSQLTENPEPDFEYPEGVTLMWNVPVLEGPTTAEIWISQREYREADWENALDAARNASAVPDLNFRFIAGERQFQLHTSTCDGMVNESSDDQKLFDEVLTSGASLLPGAGPGSCVPER